ncbi:patr class I histocompatibility antigen, CH28 alpha chain isoform X1 [Ictalurus punctatus]|uniref:Patr class I histocompatibility antigen, CH28 alpha chain isoform X1 n=1 Tax=Ictalurus punctatus TaxID=7998 RepID=A0A9F7TPN6_ICTPU|nr:patr class I histocompatibility antigen, CH28 alpha chain isoform X1 [Ictalurus punctatus]
MRHRLNINKATIIHTLVLFLHLQQSSCDVQSISWYFLGSEGLSIPRYTESVTVNDVTLYSFDSNMKSTAPCPEWLNTTAGQQLWKKTSFLSHHNMANMDLALQTAKSQFNLTGSHADINVYQAYSRCDLYPDGTTKSSLTHAFNGKDFLSLDIDSKTFIASVPQALIYKSIREKDIIWLETLVSFYKKGCFDRLRMFLEYAPGVRNKKAPQVRLFERQSAGSTLLTCHVTGFYPRAVQVKWIGADLQLVEDEMNHVLPNGDGTFQTRSSVIRPEENTGDQRYSCVVHHSSLEGNITVTWGKEEKPFRLYVWIPLGCVFIVTVVGLVIRGFCYNKEDTETEYTSYNVTCNLPQ